jgi:hypothetical protein
MMSQYCQRCGSELEQVKEVVPLWLTFYQCPKSCAAYLEVAHPNWIFPLQKLEYGVLEKALTASDELLALAAERIKIVDYKTVSIMLFEKTLLGMYRKEEDYKIVYPK